VAFGGAARERVTLAEPSVGERGHVEDAKARILPHQPVEDGARLVGGAVLHHDHLEAGIVLPKEGADRVLHARGFVAGRAHDGERGQIAAGARPHRAEAADPALALDHRKREAEPDEGGDADEGEAHPVRNAARHAARRTRHDTRRTRARRD
jgi:hypothetical protein